METEKQYYKYWGKARRNEDGSFSYHLLPYHCLDVAAVGWHLLPPASNLCRTVANYIDLLPEQVQVLFTFLMMLHDIGKFSHTFQGQIIEIFEKNFTGQKADTYTERHDTLGFSLWRGDRKNDPNCISSLLSQTSPNLSKYLEMLIYISTGHHGIPPKESIQGGGTFLRASKFFNDDNFKAANIFVSESFNFFGSSLAELPDNAKDHKKEIKDISWHFAGLGILSDWIGSNTEHFPYCSDEIELECYWKKRALPQAEKAIKKVPWLYSRKQTFLGIKHLFPFISTPTPLQTIAEKMPLAAGPKLIILEDVTGSGKTEAAIVVAARIMAAGDADGLYLGLPTMATANAMYNRMCKAYRNLYDEKDLPSLILSHGASHLSNEFSETITIQQQENDFSCEIEESASAYCNIWYADNRKKALLADIGVGTIDQALIGILPARHQSLRLLGLNRKILIIDEVHAYDPYMEHLLSVLLRAHAQGGGSVILLSATLPNKKRIELIKSFQDGLNEEDGQVNPMENLPFPLITQVGINTLVVEKVDTIRELRRYVTVEFVHTYKKVLSMIYKEAASGNCVCWVRNTVKDARKTYHDLLKIGVDPKKIELFHSRFAMVDRIRIENRAIENFGKLSGEKDRNGRILIATQVVEQSLDLDFDIMITDIAPIDLIIQRAGRLHRHVRDIKGNIKIDKNAEDDRGRPILTIFCPEFVENADSNWLSKDFSSTLAVYQNAGVLWHSLRILNEKKGWVFPEDARKLIESVYGAGCSFDVCDGLLDNVFRADGKDKSEKAMGDLNALILEKGYCRSAVKVDIWDEDVKVSTRLTDENLEIVLAVEENDKIVPYAEMETHAWDWSSLSVSNYDWEKCGYTLSIKHQKMVDELKSKVKRLKYSEIVIVNNKSNAALLTDESISENYNPHLGWGVVFKGEE